MTLAQDEFIRRYLLHVLPDGFHRIRHYGLIANTRRKTNLAKVRALLKVPPPVEPVNKNAKDEINAHEQSPTFVCPHCGSAMEVIDVLPHMYLPRAPPLRLH